MAIAEIAETLRLPGYADMLLARHRAHAETFRDIVAAMPLVAGQRVLEVACGDGAWSQWLSERLAPRGLVVGVDACADYVELARRRAARLESGDRVQVVFQQGDARDLTQADKTFDAVTCCHSFYEIDAPISSLSEMVRVLRPGGHLCLVTSDAFHHALLPWPSGLQVQAQRAHDAALAKAGDHRPFLSRHLTQVLHDLGMRNIRRRAFTTTRQGPLSEDDRRYLHDWLGYVQRWAEAEQTRSQRDELRLWVAECMERSNEPSFAVTYVDMLTHAERPA